MIKKTLLLLLLPVGIYAQDYQKIHRKAIVADSHNDILSKSIEKGVSMDGDLRAKHILISPALNRVVWMYSYFLYGVMVVCKTHTDGPTVKWIRLMRLFHETLIKLRSSGR